MLSKRSFSLNARMIKKIKEKISCVNYEKKAEKSFEPFDHKKEEEDDKISIMTS